MTENPTAAIMNNWEVGDGLTQKMEDAIKQELKEQLDEFFSYEWHLAHEDLCYIPRQKPEFDPFKIMVRLGGEFDGVSLRSFDLRDVWGLEVSACQQDGSYRERLMQTADALEQEAQRLRSVAKQSLD